MFEATVTDAAIWKKITESLKDLVNEVNFQCSPDGMSIQAMDSAHVALVSLLLRNGGFKEGTYNCERTTVLGVNLGSFAKILKTIDNSDALTLRHEDESDNLLISTVGPKEKRTAEYNLKLMEIDADQMGIPEIDYIATIELPATEFTKICKDMAVFGDTITVQVSKSGVRFSTQSDFCDGFVFLKSTGEASSGHVKAEKIEDEDDVKVEKAEPTVKAERADDDEDTPFADSDKYNKSAPPVKPPVKKNGDKNEEEDGVKVSVGSPLTLSFALRYFTIFSKGGSLADKVILKFADEQPCMIEFVLNGMGHLRFYLAPKVEGQD